MSLLTLFEETNAITPLIIIITKNQNSFINSISKLFTCVCILSANLLGTDIPFLNSNEISKIFVRITLINGIDTNSTTFQKP